MIINIPLKLFKAFMAGERIEISLGKDATKPKPFSTLSWQCGSNNYGTLKVVGSTTVVGHYAAINVTMLT
ncbi:MAG: hypothetical protein RLY57_268 [Candidatus Parcubacteria bacterium]|jgi:hypothetical protein